MYRTSRMFKGAITITDELEREFEWVLEDPTAERIKELGQIVTRVVTILSDHIVKLEETVANLESKISDLNRKVSELASRPVAASAPSPGASVSAPSPAASMASAPKPKPIASAPAAPRRPMNPRAALMSDLKAALMARRKKAESE